MLKSVGPCALGDSSFFGNRDQTLLGLVVDLGELPAHDDVVVVAGDRPRPLDHAGEGAGVDRRVPHRGRGGRLTGEVGVAVRVGLCGPGRGLAEGETPVEGPVRRGLRKAADVAAVVGVPDRVQCVTARMDRVCVAVAVVDELDACRRPSSRRRPLPRCRRRRRCSRRRRRCRRRRSAR